MLLFLIFQVNFIIPACVYNMYLFIENGDEDDAVPEDEPLIIIDDDDDEEHDGDDDGPVPDIDVGNQKGRYLYMSFCYRTMFITSIDTMHSKLTKCHWKRIKIAWNFKIAGVRIFWHRKTYF